MTVDIDAVKDIAIRAGEAIMDVYDNACDFGIETKSDDSPLTLADIRSNTIIKKGLENLDPAFPVLSEESSEIPYVVRKDFPYFWMVDPLDGTKEFIKGNGEFTVNIALIHGGTPVMGFVYIPVKKEIYWASKGGGAWFSDGMETKNLKASRFNMREKGLRVVASRSHLNEETRAYIDRLDEAVLVSKGSSLKFLAIARAEAELYPRIAPTWEWDTAAAQIILEEAGGSVVQYPGLNPMQYNKEDLLNPHFLASGTVQDVEA